MYIIVSLLLFFYVNVPIIECKICQSMAIRNSVKNLSVLRNCTEIVGSLKILLMELVESESEYDDYVFPELTKISGYLLFFKLSKLTSVARLFPNLRVIRGMELFTDYALVIHDMPDIVEIGTEKLLLIARGLVKVDLCPHLCFVDTIEWKKIGVGTIHFNNINNGICEACPVRCGDYCWNTKNCQSTISAKCHKECLECYKDNSPDHCYACKNYENEGTCVEICPINKFAHTFTNKCVTEEECATLVNGTWWTFDGECVNDCPPFYEQYLEGTKTKCRSCGDDCTKYCIAPDLESMDRLQNLRGCTHIDGSLVIKLRRTDNPQELVNELNYNLGAIKYIRERLIIMRTNAIKNLDFLRNLKVIAGEYLENDKYAIFMYGNANLQALWDFEDGEFQLEIKNGAISFHNNPLLCVSEIEKLSKLTGITFDDIDVSKYSNGDKTVCIYVDMNVTVVANSKNASFTWKKPKESIYDSYIGYTLYYKVHPTGNASALASQDECVESEWESVYTSSTSITVKNLQPYSRYAFYIKIPVAQTQMMYFQTKSDDPDYPEWCTATAIDHETINLSWGPPKHINGILAYYRAEFNFQPDGDLHKKRNYCTHPRTPQEEKIDDDSQQFSTDTTTSKPEDASSCMNAPAPKPSEEPDWMAVLKYDERYNLCDLNGQSGYQRNCKNFIYQPVDDNLNENSIPNSFTKIINANLTSYNITGLKRFSLYIFYFSACNLPKEEKKCSPILQRFARTKKKLDADDIETVKVTEVRGNVNIAWSEPENPNVAVVAYRIEYLRENSEHATPTTECISTNHNVKTRSLTLRNLLPGRYSVRVQAESLAGLGRFSERYYFDIEAPSRDSSILLPVMSVTVLTLAGALIFYWWYKRKHRLDSMHLVTSVNPDYEGAAYVEDDWEIDRSDIELQNDLGRGTFGIVYYGMLKSRNLPCAVKTVNETLSFHDCMAFLNEASVMKSFSNCHHVVRLIGVVSRGQPPLVVMELMERGDLKKFLRRIRDSSHDLTSNEIYRMAAEIADGMAYLTAKKFVHRDLAARNCMVAGDKTVKIGDFGMARDIYETDYYRKETKGLLPIRWMAPESLADGVFTSDSDVWSYGIVLWEIATLAEQPYQGFSNEQVLQFVVSKGRLERPTECSDLLYELMRRCWSWRPNDRPTFWDIVERLESHVSEDFKLVSFIHSREGHEYRIIYGRQRVYNPPALSTEHQEEMFSRYNASEDEVSLHVGGVPRRPRYLQASLSRSRDSSSSSSEFY